MMTPQSEEVTAEAYRDLLEAATESMLVPDSWSMMKEMQSIFFQGYQPVADLTMVAYSHFHAVLGMIGVEPHQFLFHDLPTNSNSEQTQSITKILNTLLHCSLSNDYEVFHKIIREQYLAGFFAVAAWLSALVQLNIALESEVEYCECPCEDCTACDDCQHDGDDD